jgi:hypothetical protein
MSLVPGLFRADPPAGRPGADIVLAGFPHQAGASRVIWAARELCGLGPLILVGWSGLGEVLLISRTGGPGGPIEDIAELIRAAWLRRLDVWAMEPPIVLSDTATGMDAFDRQVPRGSQALMIAACCDTPDIARTVSEHIGSVLEFPY